MYFQYKNQKWYYEKIGNQNNTIIILPGWGNTRKTFTNIINAFKDTHTIYILDYPGFGNSEPLKQEFTIYDYAESIKYWIKKEKIKNPYIIAHSFGGRITSILIGKEQIKANKIVLIDVAGIKRWKKLKTWIKEKIYKLEKKIILTFSKERQKEKLNQLFLKYSSSDYKTIPEKMRKTFQNIISEDLKKYYKKIEDEVLIIWGENDQDTPLKDAYLLNKIIKNSGLIIYKNADHFSYLENNKTVIILKEFFK